MSRRSPRIRQEGIRVVPQRRDFLRSAAALIACGFAPRAQGNERPRFGPFRVGLATYSLRAFPIDRAIELMQSLGIETVDLNPRHIPLTVDDQVIEQLGVNATAHQLTILSYGVLYTFTKDHSANKRIFDFAKKLGVRNITANPSEDSFDSLDKLVAEYDIRIAIHNHGPGSSFDKVAEVLTAIKNRHPNIGACADLGHYLRSGEDPARAIALLEGRLYGIHLKDFDAPRKEAKGRILGQGILDVPAVFRALKKANFPNDACLSLEYEESEKDPIADIKQCLEVAAEAASQV